MYLQDEVNVLTLLIHLGYLAYNSIEKEAFISNKEIMGEFETAMSAAPFGQTCPGGEIEI